MSNWETKIFKDKNQIRKKILETRDIIPIDVRSQKDTAIRLSLLNTREILGARRILTYVSFRSEVDTRLIIEELLRLKKEVIVPRVVSFTKELQTFIINGIDELSIGYCGILEPLDKNIFNQERKIDGAEIDICITPGVAFDEDKNRLGYGRGYYDRFLKPIKKQRADRLLIIGIAYEEQIVKSIPNTNEDIKMDIIITDKRVING